MILAHAIIGVTAGNYFHSFWPILIGSVFPDIDHLFVVLRHRFFSLAKILDSMRFEKKYNVRYKTKFVHSVFGAFIFSFFVWIFFGKDDSFYFFLAYSGHLVLDWPDCDEKYYFFPFRIRFNGILPIASKLEIVFTIIISIIMAITFT